MTPGKPTHLRRYRTRERGHASLKPPLLIIGDLHGNLPFLQSLQRQYPLHLKLFVGDILDSRLFSREEELRCLEIVLEMLEHGEARACLGNHEWSYLEPGMKCSGYDSDFDRRVTPFKERIRKHFETFFWLPKYKILVTHAGLAWSIWKEHGLTVSSLTAKLTEWSRLPVTSSPVGRIGLARGGVDPIGGTYWCDWYREFQPVPGIVQVFGHTSGLSIHEQVLPGEQGIRSRGSNYNIDCLSRVWEVLELTEKGSLRTVTVKQQ